MTKYNHSLTTYILLDLIPVLIGGPVILFAPFILGCLCCCSEKVKDTSNRIASKLALHVFGTPTGFLHHTTRQTSNEIILYVRKNKLSPLYVWILAYFVIVYAFLVAQVFWDIFLLELSYACDDTTLDCFRGNDSELIDDCSLYESSANETVTIICYQFTFSIGSGIAAVGGLINYRIPIFLMNFISYIIFGVHAYAEKKENLLSYCLLFISKYIIQYVFLLISLIGIESFLIYVLINNPQVSNTFQAMSVIFAIIVSVLFPWNKFADEGKDYTLFRYGCL